jgi:hypothetical protein
MPFRISETLGSLGHGYTGRHVRTVHAKQRHWEFSVQFKYNRSSNSSDIRVRLVLYMHSRNTAIMCTYTAETLQIMYIHIRDTSNNAYAQQRH